MVEMTTQSLQDQAGSLKMEMPKYEKLLEKRDKVKAKLSEEKAINDKLSSQIDKIESQGSLVLKDIENV